MEGQGCTGDLTEIETTELLAIFLYRAVMGWPRRWLFEPMLWGGDPEVAAVVAGEALPRQRPPDLLTAFEQALTATQTPKRWAMTVAALFGAQAQPAAFVMAGMLQGALEGEQPFLTLPQPAHAEELSSRAERLLHLSAQARARAEVCS